MKKVILSVINDLVTEQRVDKVCNTLTAMGFSVMMIGRTRRDSLPLPARSYSMHRMRLLFEKGPLFYAEYNLRLFFFLLVHKADLLVSNDLDTLPANYLAHRFKRIPLVYDSHELFTETPEVIHRKFVRGVWKYIEKWIVPKLTDVFTVSEGIAEIFHCEYAIRPRVVRNVPVTRKVGSIKNRTELGLPADKKILILQGSGINIDRGAEELTEAMGLLEGYLLLIIGGGDVITGLKSLVSSRGLDSRIRIIPKMPAEELIHYTRNADLGITIDKDTNLNYRYSLPNKLFDYIHAGIPVLASSLPEVRKIVELYELGVIIENHNPDHIAGQIRFALSDSKRVARWKENTVIAAQDLCWEKEELILKEVYQAYAG